MPLALTYRIETLRMVIRCYQPTDAEMLRLAVNANLEHLRPWMPWIKFEPQTLEQKTELVRKFRGEYDLGIDYILGIFNKQETALIGGTGMHTRPKDNARELGYWIDVNLINQGYATENCKALIKVCFEIELLDRVEIRCDPNNQQSRNIPDKLGFTLVTVLKDEIIDDKLRDTMVWSLSKADYLQRDIKDTPLKAYDVAGNEIII